MFRFGEIVDQRYYPIQSHDGHAPSLNLLAVDRAVVAAEIAADRTQAHAEIREAAAKLLAGNPAIERIKRLAPELSSARSELETVTKRIGDLEQERLNAIGEARSGLRATIHRIDSELAPLEMQQEALDEIINELQAASDVARSEALEAATALRLQIWRGLQDKYAQARTDVFSQLAELASPAILELLKLSNRIDTARDVGTVENHCRLAVDDLLAVPA